MIIYNVEIVTANATYIKEEIAEVHLEEGQLWMQGIDGHKYYYNQNKILDLNIERSPHLVEQS